MRLRFGRQASTSCDSGRSFYRCARGPFTGCCSTNPCDTGVCGDDSDSSPTTANTSNNPATTDSAAATSTTTSNTSTTSRSTSTLTSTGSSTSPSTTATSPSTATTRSAISAAATSSSSLAPEQGRSSSPPVGAIVGGVLGGLALLALLAALLWCCLKRKSKLRIKIGRGKQEVDKKREKELLEAETAIQEREKFLVAAKQRAQPQVQNGDQFAEFGGYHRDSNTAGAPGYRFYEQQNQPTSSTSSFLQPQKPLPIITTTLAPTSSPSSVQQTGVPLSSIYEKDTIDSIPILDGNELTPLPELPATTPQNGLNQPLAGPSAMASSRTVTHVEAPAPLPNRLIGGSPRTPRRQSTEFSSISSNTNSYIHTGSPISPSPQRESVAQDGVVMRSNLNGSWNRRPRPGSDRKHVMSFMEYDAENESVCSSSRRSSLRVPGKAYVVGDQPKGGDQPEGSWRR